MVAVQYQEAHPAGRLLVSCDRCRGEMAPSLVTVLPLTVLDEDADEVLSFLYLGGATESDPVIAAGVIGVRTGAWVNLAKQVLENQQRKS